MDRRTVELQLPSFLRNLPADLTAVLSVTLLTVLSVLLPVVNETPLRVLVGLPFILFIPGYAFIAALFPEAGSSPKGRENSGGAESPADTHRESGIDGIERVALSFGLSIAIVPLIGLVLNFTPWGIRLVPILTTLTAFTVIATIVAAQQRWELPSDERFAVPYRRWVSDARTELLEPETNADFALNLLLVASILLATASVGYAVAVPRQGESFSEFYLLTENETGDHVADDYPTEFTAGNSQSLVVGIGNHEHQPVTYTVIAEIQRVDIVNNSTVIREYQQVRRFQTRIEANGTWHRNHTVSLELTGERLRLQYLLYRGEPQTPLNRSAAYREVHLWINVSDPTSDTRSKIRPIHPSSEHPSAVRSAG
ncbi:DUF1616 domain-containing protein [Halobellus sp. GM3]|uniref:DUF1616 domain-containing protein n=1 Tax=Halobellus sp. GM3 TaxID=3458410 RepID=UPI00403DE9A1